jgi:2,4-dienoyl-CoA reductase-like NADH-dependent reductase (Old Yellow Enzyme family)
MLLFEESTIAGMTIKNRIIRSATHEGMGDPDGYPLEDLKKLYIRLAKGGVGAIITGYVSVLKSGRTLKNMRMFDDDCYIEAYQALNQEMKQYNVPVICQLAHGGIQTTTGVTGMDVVAPSAFQSKVFRNHARELTEAEIREIIDSFAKAVERSKKAGFDGVQFHCAHGYLLSEFLSPYTNKRDDKWGGKTENRFRIMSEIIDEARNLVGEYPLMVKLTTHEGHKNGIDLNEGIKLSELFQKKGIDALEVSCGGVDDGFNTVRVPELPMEAMFQFFPGMDNLSSFQKKVTKFIAPLMIKKHKPYRMFNVSAANAIKKHIDIPVIVVGGIRSLEEMLSILENEQSDYISLCRPLIIEPNLVNKLKEGKQKESKCIDCAFCLMGIISKQLRCYYGKINEN